MRVLILLFWFIWAVPAISEEKIKMTGISHNIREILYSEGMQKAAEAIYKKDKPTIEEMSLAYFLVESEKTDLPFDLEKYESILLEKKSPSFYIYALNHNILSEELVDLNYLFDLYEKGNKSAGLAIIKVYADRDYPRIKEKNRIGWGYNAMYIDALSDDPDNHPSLNFYIFYIFSLQYMHSLAIDDRLTCKDVSENLFVIPYFRELSDHAKECGFKRSLLKNIEGFFDFDRNDGVVLKVSDSEMIELKRYLLNDFVHKGELSESPFYKFGSFSSTFDVCDDYDAERKNTCEFNAIYTAMECSLYYWKDLNVWEKSKGFRKCQRDHVFRN